MCDSHQFLVYFALVACASSWLSLVAVTVDSGYEDFRHESIAQACAERGWEYHVEHTKIGDTMTVAMRPADAKAWFGVPPPDLSVIARSRASEFGSGADWLYTYLRSFYRDPNRPTGWNNVVFENVGMPHILWELQGQQVLHVEKDASGNVHKALHLEVPGTLSAADYDKQVADLVGYLVYMGEPAADIRKQLGVGVLIFLSLLFVVAYMLKREYWKDVH